jgi:hypothetical protein
MLAAAAGWLTSLKHYLLGSIAPYPFAYLISSDGDVQRSLEFVDRSALALGMAESADGHVSITFYQGPGIEVWDHTLDVKMTYHELGLKPALPVFDADGLLWVPYTVADRLSEEGEGVILLWAYDRQGKRWGAYPRRQFSGVKYPHSLHFDGQGRLAVAGLSSWVFTDGMYGQELKPGLSASDSHTRLEFYGLTGDERSPAYRAEQSARWAETHGGKRPEGREAERLDVGTVVELQASYAFPFSACLWPLFVLTGDGHAITACHKGSELKILRYATPLAAAAAAAELAAAEALASSLPGQKRLREAWAPPLPQKAAALQLLPSDSAVLVAEVALPHGASSIVGLQMDPSGSAFLLLDSGAPPARPSRVLSLQWPWPSIQAAAKAGSRAVVTEAPPLPPEEQLYTINAMPRSS